MSTVEGWSLHVYCDGCGSRDEFGGNSKRDSHRMAREKGWLIKNKDAPIDSVAGGRFALCRACRPEEKKHVRP